MKKILALVAILAALYVVFWNKPTSETKSLKFDSTVMPISFDYPEDYVVQEKDDTLIIMKEEDYLSILNGEREGGEGPPAITIRVIDNPNNPGPRDWAEQYPPQSNYNLKTSDVTEITVAGHPGISYDADGLYPNRNIIFGTDYRLFYINGQYLDKNSEIYRDFEPLVSSIKLKEGNLLAPLLSLELN